MYPLPPPACAHSSSPKTLLPLELISIARVSQFLRPLLPATTPEHFISPSATLIFEHFISLAAYGEVFVPILFLKGFDKGYCHGVLGTKFGISQVLDLVLEDLLKEYPEMITVNKLNGLLHCDDNCALKASFDDNSQFMIAMLRECGLAHKTVIFILDEFDLFAQGKQRLLYSLLDAMQSVTSQAVVLLKFACSRLSSLDHPSQAQQPPHLHPSTFSLRHPENLSERVHYRFSRKQNTYELTNFMLILSKLMQSQVISSDGSAVRGI
ncbi:hypothetical protein LXL04_037359 [Taraxacum kok-saghyz]